MQSGFQTFGKGQFPEAQINGMRISYPSSLKSHISSSSSHTAYKNPTVPISNKNLLSNNSGLSQKKLKKSGEYHMRDLDAYGSNGQQAEQKLVLPPAIEQRRCSVPLQLGSKDGDSSRQYSATGSNRHDEFDQNSFHRPYTMQQSPKNTKKPYKQKSLVLETPQLKPLRNQFLLAQSSSKKELNAAMLKNRFDTISNDTADELQPLMRNLKGLVYENKYVRPDLNQKREYAFMIPDIHYGCTDMKHDKKISCHFGEGGRKGNSSEHKKFANKYDRMMNSVLSQIKAEKSLKKFVINQMLNPASRTIVTGPADEIDPKVRAASVLAALVQESSEELPKLTQPAPAMRTMEEPVVQEEKEVILDPYNNFMPVAKLPRDRYYPGRIYSRHGSVHREKSPTLPYESIADIRFKMNTLERQAYDNQKSKTAIKKRNERCLRLRSRSNQREKAY